MDLHDLIRGIQDSFDKLVAENRQLREQILKMEETQSTYQDQLLQSKKLQQEQIRCKQFREGVQILLEKYDSFSSKNSLLEEEGTLFEGASVFSEDREITSEMQSKSDLSEKTNEFYLKDELEEQSEKNIEDRELLEEIVRDIEGY